MGASVGVGIVVLDAEGCVLLASNEVPSLLGLAILNPGMPLTQAASHLPAQVRSAIDDAVLRGRDASLRAVRAPARGLLDWEIVARTDPKTNRVIEVVITLAESPARGELSYQAFIHSTDAILITNRAGVIVDVNPAFERIYEFAREDCVGKTPRIVKSPTTPRAIYIRMWRDILDPAIGRWSGELTNVDKAGNEHRVLLNIDAVRDETGTITHFMGVATDVSTRRALERRAAHAEKLAALGSLAAGVAHELNTPLANILLLAENLRRRTTDPEAHVRLETLMAQTEAASRIVGSLLDFSRQHEIQFRELDLVPLVRDALAFVRGKSPPGVVIREVREEGTFLVLGDRDQLTQIVVNIVHNAIYAIGGNGVVTVRVGGDENHAILAIADTGPGIPPDVLPRIFEPFFTTKPEGKGTGLGLAICYGIVQSHGGVIEATSLPGSGATFTIRLPRAEVSA
ncbi:MAG: PAS domain S-box protein [Euryarchaeota archaeon]|nr:PAS domain S-box protein [Euryarchaeota archaeon]